MKNAFVIACGIFALAFAGSEADNPPNGDQYFESGFDGVWAGPADFTFESVKTQLPIILNFNIQGASGEGFVLLPYETKGTIGRFSVLTAINIKVKGKRLSFSFDGNEEAIGEEDYLPFIIDVSLRKRKAGFLKGRYTSEDPENPKGKMIFYPMESTKPLQGVWFGNTGKGANRETHFLQLIQNSLVSGFVISGEFFGNLLDGDFTNDLLTASSRMAGSTLDVRLIYSAGKNWLKGTLTLGGKAQKVTLLPSGIKSKKMKIKSVTPNGIEIEETVGISHTVNTELTVKGKNFADGAMIHFDNAGIEICCVKFVNSRELRANISIGAGFEGGMQIGVRAINPDNKHAEKANAITIKCGDSGGATISFTNDIQPVFDANCTGCHGVGGNAGLNLSSGAAYSNIVNTPSTQMPALLLIEPGDPDNSYLLRKIKGEGISGQRMPVGGPFLSNATINNFLTWVNEGAFDN